MKTVAFHGEAFGQFTEWARTDAKLYERLVRLITETAREPFTGLGKPEPLWHQLKGCWSRRIDQEHRLVYRVTEDAITILSCRDHYENHSPDQATRRAQQAAGTKSARLALARTDNMIRA